MTTVAEYEQAVRMAGVEPDIVGPERDPDPTIDDVPEDPGEPTDNGDDDEAAPDVDSEEVTDA